MKSAHIQARIDATNHLTERISALPDYELIQTSYTALKTYEGVIAAYNGVMKHSKQWKGLSPLKREWVETIRTHASRCLDELHDRSRYGADLTIIQDLQAFFDSKEWMYEKVTT